MLVSYATHFIEHAVQILICLDDELVFEHGRWRKGRGHIYWRQSILAVIERRDLSLIIVGILW